VFEATDNQILKLMHFFLNSRGSAANKFALGTAILGLPIVSQRTKVVRGIGIDMSPTAAIPGSAPASPCDDTSQAVLMTRSIGMEGTTTPIAAPEPHCD
jgi:hypothetical protein